MYTHLYIYTRINKGMNKSMAGKGKESFYFPLHSKTAYIEYDISVNYYKEKEQRKRKRKRKQHLQGRYIIEGMVQLLRDGLVFQLLCIQLVWRSAGKKQAQDMPNRDKRRGRERKGDLADETECV